jgi:hypothetical protein
MKTRCGWLTADTDIGQRWTIRRVAEGDVAACTLVFGAAVSMRIWLVATLGDKVGFVHYG